MVGSPTYTPPKVWTWTKPSGGTFASINRPISGPTHEKELPVGRHPLQLYSLATPNGQKVTILLEELLALGHSGAEYDAWLIRIGEGEQFGSGFVDVNPNSKIPALMDRSGPQPVRVFESGSILLYLAEKFGAFLPTDPAARTEALNWLFWQMGSAPYLGGGFGHFYAYAPMKIEYAIDRFAMEVKRQLDVLDRRLAESEYLVGADYTIADIAVLPWYGGLLKSWQYNAAEFLSVQDYTNLQRWADVLLARSAVKRGRMVNRMSGNPSEQLRERHDASDFELRTEDKRAGARLMTAHTASALAPSNEAPRSTIPISSTDWRSSVQTATFRRLIHTKRRVIAGLLGSSLGFFFVVLLLAGYARPFMTAKFAGPLNVGYALLIATYLVSWGAALLYTLAAHRTFDPLAREAASDVQARRAVR